MTVAKAIAHAWSDAEFKARLLSDPHAALAEHGVEVPAGTTIKVVENTENTQHLVLPVIPDAFGQLPLDDLEKVAAGKVIGIDTPDCI